MSGNTHLNRLEFLDGVRGWGALIVFLYHLVERFLAHADARLVPTWASFLFDGPFAVLVFFVVSGFALSYANLRGGLKDLSSAATARYFRLCIPVLVTSFAGYLMLKAGIIVNLEASRLTGVSPDWLGRFFDFEPSFYSFLKFSVFNVFFSYYPDLSYNTNLWTISVEFLGSLVIYAYLAIFRRDGKPHWIIATAMFAVFLKIAPYYACFVGGYLVAEAVFNARIAPSWKWVVEMCALVGCYAVAMVITFFRPGSDAPMALLATVLVLSIAFSTPLKRFFSTRLASFLGKVSFPFYLTHLFVICSWSSALFVLLPRMGVPTMPSLALNIVTSLAISIAVAVALVPMERFSIRYSKRIAAVLLGSAQAASLIGR
jgi:peptidoglycan/LPS O-acetylase OafA/YrhL